MRNASDPVKSAAPDVTGELEKTFVGSDRLHLRCNNEFLSLRRNELWKTLALGEDNYVLQGSARQYAIPLGKKLENMLPWPQMVSDNFLNTSKI
jgi:hypothetical protein